VRTGISVALKDGGTYYGRVEVTYDNHTGTICDKAWSTSDARVICKQLGYADGDPVTGTASMLFVEAVILNGLVLLDKTRLPTLGSRVRVPAHTVFII